MFISVVIPSVGRETLNRTINSVNEEVRKNINYSNSAVFFNGVEPEIFIQENHDFPNFKYGKSSILLPPWHSMRQALLFSKSEYTWLIGDDDQIKEGSIKKLSERIEDCKKLDSYYPNLIILDGYYDNYNGDIQPLVPTLQNDHVKIANHEELLHFLAADLHLLNNGRFIVDNQLLQIWTQQADTEVETYHEEYRALFLAASEVLRKNGVFIVLLVEDKLVSLGNVQKSWRQNHDLAVLGEIAMLQLLPKTFGETREYLVAKHLKTRTKLRYLVSLRLAVQGRIRVHEALRISRIRRSKILAVNVAPILLAHRCLKAIRIIKKFFV